MFCPSKASLIKHGYIKKSCIYIVSSNNSNNNNNNNNNNNSNNKNNSNNNASLCMVEKVQKTNI